jgi:hypothetical protein
MTIAQQIGRQVMEKEAYTNAKLFCHVAKWVALAKNGGLQEAHHQAKLNRALPPIVNVLKTAADAGSTTGWGSPLADQTGLADAFLASLSNVSIYQAALPFMPRVPFRTTVRVVSSGATGAMVNEAMTKPVTRLTLSASDMNDQKTLAICAITEELLRQAGISLFQSEMERAVTRALDTAFITKITTGITPTVSAGGGPIAVLTDFTAGLTSLALDSGSKVFCAVSPDIAKQWAFKTTTSGARMFPELTVNGGVVGGVTVFPTDGVTGQAVFFDATQIANADSGIEVSTAKYATLQLDTVGDSPPSASTPYLSLWQMNMVGVKAIRHWAAERTRTGAVAVISNVTYSGDSPA